MVFAVENIKLVIYVNPSDLCNIKYHKTIKQDPKRLEGGNAIIYV